MNVDMNATSISKFFPFIVILAVVSIFSSASPIVYFVDENGEMETYRLIPVESEAEVAPEVSKRRFRRIYSTLVKSPRQKIVHDD
ncbi:unnamed protein product [Hymenolepis diminuta]|uniref:Uncharacterized protein n=1 Tax=Hymenolepis diminuta TaxID=6216 RepID=A0A3P6XW38_HYMDI|nr:unnamed protein product [Hymenolepis diminuta]